MKYKFECMIVAIGGIILFSVPAQAYIDAVGGGLIFQLGYIIFIGILAYIAMPFKKIIGIFKRKKDENKDPDR